jgi:transposase
MSQEIMTDGFTSGEREGEEIEVVARAQRRRFSTKYKLRICTEAEKCTKHGELGALLRREGLHSSTVRRWRNKRDEGVLGAPRKRGPKVSADSEMVRELAKKDKRIHQLEKKLRRAEMIIDVQKKVSTLLGESLDENDEKI